MARHLLPVSGLGSPTAAPFVTEVNAALSGLLDKVIISVQIVVTDKLPAYTRQIQAIIEYEDGGVTMSAPYRVTVLESEDEIILAAQGESYFAANASSFIAPIQFRYTDQLPNLACRYLSLYFDCTDATNGAANYQVNGSSAGGGGVVPGGNTAGSLLYSTGSLPTDLTWLPQGAVGRFLKSTLTGLVYSAIVAADVGYTPTTPGNWPSVPTTAQQALDTLASQATGFLPLAGGTLTGLLILDDAVASHASLRIPVGVNPTTPVDGDIWRTASTLSATVGATTYDLTAPVRVNQALATGLLKTTTGTGTLATATAGTDYVTPGAITTSSLSMSTARLLGRTTAATGAIEEISVGSGLSLSGGVLTNTGATGTVTSVALASPAEFAVSGSPVTSTGTLTFAWANQNPGIVFAGPASGGAAVPTFRTLVASDIPALSYISPGAITTSGLTMSSARLLGRTTAGTGAVEEMTVGAGLSLAAGVLSATGAGSVTSVALSAPTQFSVSGSPVTSTGTLTFAWLNQSPGIVFAGPVSGGAAAPTFRTLVSSDIPALAYAPTGAITASGLTMSTARLLGRTTAATGAIEEISVGTGLSLAGGVLSSTNAGTVTGTGTANNLAMWTGTSVIANSGITVDATDPSAILNLAPGSAPVTPQNGDFWNTSAGFFGYVSGAQVGPFGTGFTTLTGDVTGSGTGTFATTIAANAVTLAKFQQIATNSLLGRSTAATGNVEVITVGSGLLLSGGTLTATAPGGTVTSVSVVTANGVSGSVATATTTPAITLTLGAITPTSVLASGTIVGSNVSGTNTGDQTITLTGDVTGSGTGSFAATIDANAVTLSKFQQITTNSLLGRSTAATGNVEVITVGSGLSLSGGVLTNTGATGTVTSVSVVTANGVSGSVATATTTPAITLTLGVITPTSVAAAGTVTGSNLSGTNTGDQTITLTGDVTGSGTGSFAATIAANAVTLAKFQQVATGTLLGRSTITTGNIEVITVGSGLSLAGGILSTTGGTGTVTSVSVVTANGVSGSVATATTTPAITLTLGDITPTSVAASGTVTGSNLSGTNTGDQTITLTGDVTGSGTGSFATSIASGSVILSDLANLAANSIIGNNTGSPATPLALSGTQVTAMLNVATSSLKGLVPVLSGNSTNYFAGDGSWVALPAGVTGTGTTGTLSKWTGTSVLSNSLLSESSTTVTLTGGVTATNTSYYSIGSINDFLQYDIKNTSTGTGASSTYSLTADNGTLTTGFMSININNSGFTAVNAYSIGISGDTSILSSSNDMYLANASTTKDIIISTGKVASPFFDERLRIANNSGVGAITATTQRFTYTQVVGTGTVTGYVMTGAAHTALTASTESIDANFNLARTVQWATGAITTQRAFVIQAPTYAFVGASTITNAITLDVATPAAGANATLTNAWAIRALGTGGLVSQQAATQDVLRVVGRAGGTTSLIATLTPGVLTSSITLTTPLASGTLTTGSGTANQIASWGGTNSLVGAATLTLTTTSGAALFAHAAGTSTATTTTAAATHSVTFSGAATTGPMSALSAAATSTGTIATAGIQVNGLLASVTATPGAAVAAIGYIGATISATRTSAANVFSAAATLTGAVVNATFNTANTTGAAVLTALSGITITPSIVTTNASGVNTIADVFALRVLPGTFSSTGGGGLTITNYYGVMIDTLTLTTMTVTNRYGVFQNDPSAINLFNGDVKINTAGKGLFIKEGSNAKMGTATLVAGTVTVSTTAINANSRIFLTSNVDGGTNGFVRVSAKTNGTSFVITSSNAADTSTVAWMIVDAA